MFSLDNTTNENNEDHKKWLYIPDNPYRMLIAGSPSRKKMN